MSGLARVNAFKACLITAAGTYEAEYEMEIANYQGIIDEETEKNDLIKKIKSNDALNLKNVTFYPGSQPHHTEIIPKMTLFSSHIIGVYLKDRL